MRGITHFRHLMSSTVLIAAQTGTDRYGKPTYGSDVSYPAHIGRERSLIRTSTGQQAESQQTVWIATADAIQVTSRITLSTADVGSTELTVTQPPIVGIARLNDQTGPHHVAVYL